MITETSQPRRRFRESPASRALRVKCSSSNRAFLRFAFKAKSKISPNNGMTPTRKSAATLPSMRASVSDEAPVCQAWCTITSETMLVSASPSPGTTPRIESNPNRSRVPGTAKRSSINAREPLNLREALFVSHAGGKAAQILERALARDFMPGWDKFQRGWSSVSGYLDMSAACIW